MPTPHEFATSMLVKNSPDQINSEPVEPGTLLEYHLISLERLTASHRRPYRTNDGDPVLKTIARLSTRPRARSFGARPLCSVPVDGRAEVA
jgi:hypothetical protein